MVVAGWKETRRVRMGAWVWKKFKGKRCGREALVYSGRWGPSAAYARSSYQDALALASGTPFPMRGACWWAAAWSATCTSIVLLSVYAIVEFSDRTTTSTSSRTPARTARTSTAIGFGAAIVAPQGFRRDQANETIAPRAGLHYTYLQLSTRGRAIEISLPRPHPRSTFLAPFLKS